MPLFYMITNFFNLLYEIWMLNFLFYLDLTKLFFLIQGHTDSHMALLDVSTNSLIVGDHCVG